MTWEQSPPPTTPTDPPSHGGSSSRGLESTPQSRLMQGRFGRMFRNLPIFEGPDSAPAELATLAAKMISAAEPDKPLDADDEDQNPDIPAGYTYLGQFIDHDITFDPVSSLQRQNDPNALSDFRTPRFDLDSLYGRGPSDQPYLYQPGPDGQPTHLRLGLSVSDNPGVAGPDLLRLPDPAETALIGDPRNDENLVVSQLQVAFLTFHNKVADSVIAAGLSGDQAFKEAQRLVRWHYQWVVVHDFLRRVAGDDVVNDILVSAGEEFAITSLGGDGTFAAGEVTFAKPKLRFYGYRNDPYMPVEFSAAAYRFGHSMIRPSYFFNDVVRTQTDPNRTPIFSANVDPLASLRGGRRLPGEWGFQWKYFFELGADAGGGASDAGDADDHLPQPSYRIDTQLSNPLGDLPSPPPPVELKSLALRNLLRGLRLGLPAGQTVARAMGIEPLSEEELDLADAAPSFVGHAPLWYYVLREAQLRADGRRLGPVGGRIVAEVLIGLLAADPLSYLRVEPNWKPTLGDAGTEFKMPDLLRFAGLAGAGA
jgi:hypothetical protein